MSDSYYNFDPVFYDDSDFIKCNVCEREYDHNEYRSLTCEECESEQVRQQQRERGLVK